MAKIWDFDILRFALSKTGEIALLIGYFHLMWILQYECLKAIGRITNTGKSYTWIEEALDRLTTTAYKGNIFKEDEQRSGNIHVNKY